MTTLALKYRPRLLSDLVGQEGSVKALANALKRAKESGKIHQAYLFAGVRGTGKTSTARILARALNCTEGPTAVPCGVCAPCRAAEQPDTSLDIVEIDAASRASVADARALREQVQTRPAFCRYRIYIIDEVHMLSTEAFNALLKVIEEPPPHAIFVLATTELQDVPDTIKSRVQIFPFRLIPVGLIEGRLKHVCEQEGVTFERESLRLVAEAGQGSMRDALTILDRVISAGDGKVLEEAVREQLGIVSAHLVQGVLSALAIGDTAALVEACRELAEQGADWATFWRELVLAFRDRLEQEARAAREPQELLRWARMLSLLLSRERDLRDSSLPRVVVELALITAAQLPHLAPLDALVSGLAASGAPRPPTPSAGPPPVPFRAPQAAPAPEGLRRPAAAAKPPSAPGPAPRPARIRIPPISSARVAARPCGRRRACEPWPPRRRWPRNCTGTRLSSASNFPGTCGRPSRILNGRRPAPTCWPRLPRRCRESRPWRSVSTIPADLGSRSARRIGCAGNRVSRNCCASAVARFWKSGGRGDQPPETGGMRATSSPSARGVA